MSRYYSTDEWFQLFTNGLTDFYSLLARAHLTKSQACLYLGVSPRQIERYQQGHNIPRAVIIALQFKAGSLQHFGPNWAGFSMGDDCLFIPCHGVRDVVPFEIAFLRRLNSVKYHDDGFQLNNRINNDKMKELKQTIVDLENDNNTLKARLDAEQLTVYELRQLLDGKLRAIK